MDILILGNGFDIAHGLKTKYSDFLEYCNDEYQSYIRGIKSNYMVCYEKNIWMKHFITRQSELKGDTWIDLEEEIYSVIQSIQKLPIVVYAKTNKKSSGYILEVPIHDTELNLCKLSKILKTPHYGDTLKKEGFYNPLDRHYIKYYIENYIDLINLLYKHLRDFTKVFEQYLHEEVLSNMDNAPKYNLCINSKCVSLLSFNYTDTCERLYKINFNHNDCGIKTQAVYVHGKIKDNDNCNLVLGTYSFDNEEIPAGFNVFRKHNQRHRYATIEKYQDLLNELKYPKKRYIPTFHIIGHSLDKSDHNILKHILLARDNSRINIYYHDQDVLERLINNITDIIGEEEVMSKVRFIHQHNDERSILKEINPT